jgi:hypothetical protein
MTTSDVWLVVYGVRQRVLSVGWWMVDFQSFDRLWFRSVASNPPLLGSEVEVGHVETSLLCQVRSVDLLLVPQLNVGIQDQEFRNSG